MATDFEDSSSNIFSMSIDSFWRGTLGDHFRLNMFELLQNSEESQDLVRALLFLGIMLGTFSCFLPHVSAIRQSFLPLVCIAQTLNLSLSVHVGSSWHFCFELHRKIFLLIRYL